MMQLTEQEKRLILDSINTQIRQLNRFVKKDHGLAGIAVECIRDLDKLSEKFK